jgi:hypothetical protein
VDLSQIEVVEKDGTTVEVYDAHFRLALVLRDGRTVHLTHMRDTLKLEVQEAPNIGTFETHIVGKKK